MNIFGIVAFDEFVRVTAEDCGFKFGTQLGVFTCEYAKTRLRKRIQRAGSSGNKDRDQKQMSRHLASERSIHADKGIPRESVAKSSMIGCNSADFVRHFDGL